MHEQVADRTARLGGDADPAVTPACAVVAVASGPGVQRLYGELGVLVVDGGPTMNPSTYELLAGIHAAERAGGARAAEQPERDPGGRAGRRAVRQARRGWCRRRRPRRASRRCSRSTRPAGARTTREPSAAPPGSSAWRASPRPPATTPRVASARATRSATWAASWSPGATRRATLATILERVTADAELLTCLAGDDPPLGRDAVEARVPDGVELEYHEGGQPAWWWLLAAE